MSLFLHRPHSVFVFLSVDTQWQGETQEFCPGAKVVLVGCKLDLRTDLNVMRELSKHRLIPCTHEQVSRAEKTPVSTKRLFLQPHPDNANLVLHV